VTTESREEKERERPLLFIYALSCQKLQLTLPYAHANSTIETGVNHSPPYSSSIRRPSKTIQFNPESAVYRLNDRRSSSSLPSSYEENEKNKKMITRIEKWERGVDGGESKGQADMGHQLRQ